MKVSPMLAGALALQPLDFAAQGHDLRLERGQNQVMARPREGKQAGQPLGFRQGVSGLRQPAVMI